LTADIAIIQDHNLEIAPYTAACQEATFFRSATRGALKKQFRLMDNKLGNPTNGERHCNRDLHAG
jgi:hypothetical protein